MNDWALDDWILHQEEANCLMFFSKHWQVVCASPEMNFQTIQINSFADDSNENGRRH